VNSTSLSGIVTKIILVAGRIQLALRIKSTEQMNFETHPDAGTGRLVWHAAK